ncbi:MAG: alanine dehydrogenase [Armatimonadota bacterium]
MIIGIPKEIKVEEDRVAAVPAIVESLVRSGHEVIVETCAGCGIGLTDDDYKDAGAKIAATAAEVYAAADMIVKVKEPLPKEYGLIKNGQVLFTYFHLAADQELTKAMMDSGAVCIAYETIEAPDGSLPLLTPMSEVAGRMAVQEGAKYLEHPMGGKGVLLGGVPGVAPANVVVIGGGIAGTSAAKIAAGMGANVIVIDINIDRLRYLDEILPANVQTLMSNSYNIRSAVKNADLVIGSVLRHGAKTPVLVTRDMLKLMKPKSVIVDIAVDQGGCFETTHPTTHTDPTFVEEGIIHYCVANMPGAVAHTSTYALTNATAPYILQLANKGWKQALKDNPGLLKGLNAAYGKLTISAVAELFGLKAYSPESVM